MVTKTDSGQITHNGGILKTHIDEIGTALGANSVDMQNARDAAINFALEQSGVANKSIQAIDLKAGKSELLPSFSAWDYERQAEILRGLGQSGFFLTRQYTRGGPDAFNRPYTSNYNPTNIHNHVNYAGMPGMAEFSAIVNGYYLRSRHNDYKLRKPSPAGSKFLATDDLPAPAVPASVTGAGSVANQIAKMRELFQRYDQGEWPEGFAWTLSYVEMWFEVYSPTVNDTFDSFRHQQYATTVDAALREALKFNYGGYKNPAENLSFETPIVRAIDASGNPVFARLRYRIAAVDVTSLGDLRSSVVPYDDWGNVKHRGTQVNRFRIREVLNAPSKLDEMMQLIPGLDGEGAVLTEKYGNVTIGEYADANSLNAAYYSRFAAGQVDASNRSNFRRGFNDPMLFVAQTTRPEVAAVASDGVDYRFSYALPLELILRTPLERWNPYNAPEKTLATLTGNGLQNTPYNGWTPDLRNFHTPSEFFGDMLTLTQTDQADSGTSGAYVTTPSGAIQMRGSGIYVTLPSISSVANPIRVRYPIYPVYHEGSHAYAQAEAMQIEMNVMRGKSDIALDQVVQANHGLKSLRNQAMQDGVIKIANRGIVSGCDVVKSTTATRNLSLSSGIVFSSGRTHIVNAKENTSSVPGNSGAGAVTLYVYLKHTTGVWDLAITQSGENAPDGAIVLYSLTVPAGNTDSTDPYMTNVTMTDMRRIEPHFPNILDNPATISPSLNPLRSNDYLLAFDVESAVGAPCSKEQIIVTSRATNGFTIELASAADEVVLHWKISKLNN